MFASIDRLLRGDYTNPDALRTGSIPVPTRTLAISCVVLGAVYGSAMGLFAALGGTGADGWLQVFASSVKVPLLFLSTLVVTYPSLYIVSALARSSLQATDTLKLLLVVITVNLALLASLAPVTAFFTLSTDTYAFMSLLNVAVFTVSGLVGLGFLKRALRSMYDEPRPLPPRPPVKVDVEADPDAPLVPIVQRTTNRALTGDASQHIFRAWIFVYGIVGAQMGWILRPFIGDPGLEFSWFRARESNFLQAFFRAIHDLMAGS